MFHSAARAVTPNLGINMSAATPEYIMQVGLGFWASKTLLSAVELGLFSTLAEAPADLPTLQKKLALHQRSARDFLDALVALKLLERENGIYSNTADTDQFLDRAKPSYIGGALEMANARLYGFWGSLTEAVRTGESQNESKVEEKTPLRRCMPIRIGCRGF
jgi:hypothetical protein